MKKEDVEVDGADEWEPIWLLQVRVTVIQGTEEWNYGTGPGLRRPTVPAKVREGEFSPYTSHVI
jgi:hypothetical protein